MKEVYNELNEKLECAINTLKQNCPKFYNNIDFWTQFAYVYFEASKPYIEYFESNNEDSLSYSSMDATIQAVSDFLGKISQDYQNFFLELYKRDIINFNASENQGGFGENDYVLNIAPSNTKADIPKLIHEFFHCTNICDDGYYFIRKQLTEFISSFFENYYCQNLE